MPTTQFFPEKKYKIVISWQAPTLICQANYLWPYTFKDPAKFNWGGQTPPKLTESRSGLSWKLSSISKPPTSFVQFQTWPSLGLHQSGLVPPLVWQFVQFYKILSSGTEAQSDPSQDSILILVWFAPVFPPSHFPSPLATFSIAASQPINKLSSMVRKLINLLKYLNLFQNSWWFKWAKVLPEPHF